MELVEFLKRIKKEIPDFGERGLVKLGLGNISDRMVVVKVDDDRITYRVDDDSYLHTWSPQLSTMFRWCITNVKEQTPDRGTPNTLIHTSTILLRVDKVFGNYSRRTS